MALLDQAVCQIEKVTKSYQYVMKSLALPGGDQQRRWDLGAAAERDHEGFVLQTARNWALEAKEQARRGIFPGPFLDRLAGRTAPPAAIATASAARLDMGSRTRAFPGRKHFIRQSAPPHWHRSENDDTSAGLLFQRNNSLDHVVDVLFPCPVQHHKYPDRASQRSTEHARWSHGNSVFPCQR